MTKMLMNMIKLRKFQTLRGVIMNQDLQKAEYLRL